MSPPTQRYAPSVGEPATLHFVTAVKFRYRNTFVGQLLVLFRLILLSTGKVGTINLTLSLGPDRSTKFHYGSNVPVRIVLVVIKLN